MTQLTSYLPIDRRLALADGTSMPEDVHGTALVADISGFTPLAAALVTEMGHEQGVEELTRRLNHVYAACIDQVHDFRGSVVSFAGDAITVWFDGDDGRRAVACALAMQEKVGTSAQIGTETANRIGVKISIVGGAARRFVVGDPAIQLYDVLAGELPARLACAEDYTGDGEVLVDAWVSRQLGADLVRGPQRDVAERGSTFVVVQGLRAIPPRMPWQRVQQTVPEETLSRWIPRPVFNRLLHGEAQFLAELRPSAALFLRFENLSYDTDPDARNQLDRAVRWVQHTTSHYGGTLIDLSIGDHGTYLYVAFGAPVAHDNNAERAVAAALALRTPPSALPFIRQVRIGITHGQVRTGAYGSATRRTYGVLGSPVNLAARLVGVAPAGEIRCDFATYRAAASLWQFDALLPVRVKGRADLIRVYKPTGLRHRAADTRDQYGRHRLIGRGHAAQTVRDALDAVIRGRQRVLLIQGEAGIGKTRLLDSFVRLLRERGLAGLQGSGNNVEQHAPYRAWRHILTGFFDLEDSPDAEWRARQIKRVVTALAPEQLPRLPLLNGLLETQFPDTDLSSTLEPELQQQNLALLVAALLRAWAREHPLILILEDAHWLDTLSWDLACRVARMLQAVDCSFLLVIATRPLAGDSHARRNIDDLQSAVSTTILDLAPLEDGAMSELIAANLAVDRADLPEALNRFVRERARGNPLFARELLLDLQEREIIHVDPAAQPGAPARLEVAVDLERAGRTLPDTLQGLILARLDRLPPGEQWLLKVTAVCGSRFSRALLQHVVAGYSVLRAEVVGDTLETLSRRALLVRETEETEETWSFDHVLVQQVAYQTLLFSQRRALHGQVLQWYEELFLVEWLEKQAVAGTPNQMMPAAARFLPLLVHHARQAGDRMREQHYAWMAGQHAAGQMAFVEAVDYYSAVLKLAAAEESALRYQVLLAREEAHDILCRRDAQAEDLAALDALSREMGSEEAQAHVALRRAHFCERISDYDTAIQSAQAAVARASAGQSIELMARAHLHWGLILNRKSQFEAAFRQLQRAHQYAQSVGAQRTEARALRALGVSLAYQGKYREALDYYRPALDLFQGVDDRSGECQALDNIGTSLHYLGKFQQAHEYYVRALDSCRQIGYRDLECRILNNLGLYYATFGDFRRARSHIAASRQIAHELGDRHGENLALNNLGGLDHDVGDFQQGESHGRAALALAQKIGARQDEANAYHTLGNNLLGQKRFSEAVDAFRRAMTLRQEIGQPQASQESRAGLAIAQLRHGQHRRAVRNAEQVMAYLQESGTDGTEAPYRIYARCVQVLSEGNDPRVPDLLHHTCNLLLEEANRIEDSSLRHAFMQRIPDHRQLLALAAESFQQPNGVQPFP